MFSKLEKIIGWLWWLFIFLLPWQTVWILNERTLAGVKWQSGTNLIFATEILLWLIIFLQLIVWLFRRPVVSKRPWSDWGKLLIVIASWLFLIWSGLACFFSGDRGASVVLWFKLLEGGVVFFLILSVKIKTEKILWALIFSGTVQALLALWQFFYQAVFASKWLGLSSQLPSSVGAVVLEANGFWLRSYGSWPHPNILGGWLALSFLAVLIIFYWSAKNLSRPKYYFLLISSLIITAGLFFSFSRSAWLGACLGVVAFLVINFSKQRFWEALKISRFIFYAVALVIILIILYQPLVFSRVSSTGNLEDISRIRRSELLLNTWQVIGSRPFWGVGLNNYVPYSYQHQLGNLPAKDYQPVHNFYLLIWSELGVVGLLLWLFFFFSVLIYSFRQKNFTGWPLVVVFLVIGFFDHYFWTLFGGITIWWLLLALLLRPMND